MLLRKVRIAFFLLAMSVFFSAKIANSQSVTFSNSISKIIHAKCSPCHREGESAPFSLLSFADVSSKAKIIQAVVNSGIMPPWKQDPTYRHFENENILSTAEIKLINDWVQSGAAEGSGAVGEPGFASFSSLGKADYIVPMKVPFPIKGNNSDVFAWIKYPYKIESETDSVDVEAIDFVPVNKKLLHHVSYEIVGSDEENAFSRPFFLMENGPLGNIDPYQYLQIPKSMPVFINGWLPGFSGTQFPGDMGVRIPKTGVILMNMVHYAATPVHDYDSSYFKIYLKKKPFKRRVYYSALTSGAKNAKIVPPLIIPADSVKTFKSISEVNQNISLMYVSPHMHLLGKKFVAYAVEASGDTIPLIRITNWDFNWQQVCKLNPMVPIKSGSQIIVEGTYDNTSNNPKNPFSPPQTIYSEKGMKTTEEMLGFGIHYVLYKAGDEKQKY